MKRKLLAFVIAAVLIIVFQPAFAANQQLAIAYYNRAIELRGASNDPMVLFKKEQLYKKAIELWPDFAKGHNNLADIYERQGRFKEAIEEYKKAIKLAPHAAYPYFGLGDVYFKTGRMKEAVAWYKEGLKYDPNDRLTLKRLKFLKDVVNGKVIKAETMVALLNSSTRAVGDVVSLSFGEGLIPFDFDRSKIRPDARPQLDEIGKALKTMTSTRQQDVAVLERERAAIHFEIAGHTDPRGSDAYNLRLSERRAQAVVDYLVRHFGIPKDKLIPRGYGERRPLCAGASEACYALNRRVEIIKRTGKIAGKNDGTRGVSSQASLVSERKLTVDVGLFYQRGPGRPVYSMQDEKTILRSHRDRYFVFFRPVQDCYCYLLQEDGKGHVDLLYPKEGDGFVKKGSDIWVPGFGKCFTLDSTKGEEKLYLMVSARSIETDIEGLSLKENVQRAVRAFQTRTLYVKAPKHDTPMATTAVSQAQHDPHRLDEFLERIEGEGAWVRVVRFAHE